MKKKPQTIADLKINWTFNEQRKSLSQLDSRFSKLNPLLSEYKILKNEYRFLIKNKVLINHSDVHQSLANFIAWLEYQTWYADLNSSLKLIRFELIKENTFKIHVEEIKE